MFPYITCDSFVVVFYDALHGTMVPSITRHFRLSQFSANKFFIILPWPFVVNGCHATNANANERLPLLTFRPFCHWKRKRAAKRRYVLFTMYLCRQTTEITPIQTFIFLVQFVSFDLKLCYFIAISANLSTTYKFRLNTRVSFGLALGASALQTIAV